MLNVIRFGKLLIAIAMEMLRFVIDSAISHNKLKLGETLNY